MIIYFLRSMHPSRTAPAMTCACRLAVMLVLALPVCAQEAVGERGRAAPGAASRAEGPRSADVRSEAPEAASGRADRPLVLARRHMIVAAHPLAAAAGREVLRDGGNAVDAAIAAAFVLNVVEPQSSGIGGGGFLLHFERSSRALSAWDGREIAPFAALPDRFLGADGRPRPFVEAVGSGLSVGAPALLAMLEAAHKAHGKLPWARLLEPAIRIAREGFAISPRLAALIAADTLLPKSPTARSYFFHGDGAPKRAGERIANPALAEVFARVAGEGAEAFYRGEIAAEISAVVQAAAIPGDLTEFDLAAVVPQRRTAVCGAYRAYAVCGMPPPSSGGIAVAQVLGLLERLPIGRNAPDSLEAVHAFAEAGRLAYADRDHFLADPDYADQPVLRLLDRRYLAARSALIRPDRSMNSATHGEIPGLPARGADRSAELPATTHLSVVDGAGNAVALTASIDSAFGSRMMVRGFLLNNQLTDFSFVPDSATEGGKAPIANRVEAGKRPRSSMAP
ncbi:MAG: gamma-glutamyltransferase family protein, partial [Betaproteobacteria bacterium]|nr:gamma-glutamyltransferase family protein [Betaproteobacteria bacterium]